MAVRTGVTGLDFLHRRRRPSTRRRRRHQKRGQPRHSHSRAARPLQYPHGESKKASLSEENRGRRKRRLQIRLRKPDCPPRSTQRRSWPPPLGRKTGCGSRSPPCPPRSSPPSGLFSEAKTAVLHQKRPCPDALPCPATLRGSSSCPTRSAPTLVQADIRAGIIACVVTFVRLEEFIDWIKRPAG